MEEKGRRRKLLYWSFKNKEYEKIYS